jgi:hypothetical protein
MHTAKSLKAKNHIVLSYKRENQKHVLTCILAFNNQFIKVTRTWPIFQEIKKKFSIRDYKFIHKMYSDIKKGFFC